MAKNVNDKKIKQEPPKKLDDGLTKAGRRTRNIALKTAAMEKALAADLPWDDGIKALRFFEDPDAAYLEATTSVNAIPAAVIIAKQKEISAGIEAANAEHAAKKADMLAALDVIEKQKTSAEKILEAKKAFDAQVSAKAEDVKPLVETSANDNTEMATAEMEMKPDEPSEKTPSEQPATEAVPEPTTTPETTPEATPVDQPDAETTAEVNPRDRRPGEKTKAYNQRIHKLDLEERRLKKAAKAIEAVTAATETRNGEPVIEGDAGNAQADLPVQIERVLPKNTRLLTAEEIAWWEGRNSPVPEHVPSDWTIAAQEQTIAAVEQMKTATQADDETKVSDELVEHGSFAAVAAAEKAEESKPVEIPAEETPAETPAPVQTEPEVTPESGPVEAKTTTKPKLTIASSQEEKPEMVAAAKKFYGSTWTDERAPLLTKAYKWMTIAVKLSQEPNITATRVNLPMNAALRHEAEAFGCKPVIYNHAVDGGVTMTMAA